MIRRILTTALAAGVFAACGDSTGPEGTANLSIAFATTAETNSGGADLAALSTPGTARSIEVGGTNGTLIIDEIWVIVSEFELEGALAACDDAFGDDDGDDDGFDDDCEEFESPATLVRIPTDGTRLEVLSAAVPLGTYSELEWEVEDVDFDDDDDDEQELQNVRAEIEDAFGAGVWPAEASMAVAGTFQAEGTTDVVPFTTFFDAEIEVEMDLSPALVISEEGASRELTIVLSPEIWFQNVDGSVMNLAALDGEVVEFEAEFEDGVLEIERDDDDDD